MVSGLYQENSTCSTIDFPHQLETNDGIVPQPSYVSSSQSILITSTVYRSQSQNIQDCLKKVSGTYLSRNKPLTHKARVACPPLSQSAVPVIYSSTTLFCLHPLYRWSKRLRKSKKRRCAGTSKRTRHAEGQTRIGGARRKGVERIREAGTSATALS